MRPRFCRPGKAARRSFRTVCPSLRPMEGLRSTPICADSSRGPSQGEASQPVPAPRLRIARPLGGFTARAEWISR